MIMQEEPATLINRLLDADWTQAEIAERIGVSQPTVSRVKDGVISDLKSGVVDKLRALAKEVSAP